MDFKDKIAGINKTLLTYKNEGKEICITSSFQTHSLPLLHLVVNILPEIPVLFIDTGFHFPETYSFRNEIVKEWNLNLINITSATPKIHQRDEEGKFYYASNPEYCCHINKVEPLNPAVEKYDIWIAGLRRDQTSHRKNLSSEEKLKSGVIKYHPILEWNSKMIYEYRKKYNLPAHPLEDKGFLSVGCLPCTNSIQDDAERAGRWFGSNKTECGIHLNS